MIRQFLRCVIAPLMMLIAGIAATPASALTVTLGPSSLALSPGGPYSSARDDPVGTVIATATSTINIAGLSGTCTMTAVFLSTSPASGNTYTTGLAGLGVNLFYIVGGARTQITPGLQLSLLLDPAHPGPVTIEADLVVTGPVASGSLTALPSVGVIFAGVGLGCGLLNVSAQTLNVTTTAGSVTAISCTVNLPSLAITLPTVSAQTLSATGKTGGATNFSVLMNCTGTGAGIYVTLTDATNVTNTTSALSLTPGSTAGNVKLQILNGAGSVVSYGPDSALLGNLNQWYVGPTASVTNVPLIVQYLATGTATPGTVFALATFTLSYQ